MSVLVKKDAVVNIRVTSEIYSRLKQLAIADERTLANYAERVLRRHVEEITGERLRRAQ